MYAGISLAMVFWALSFIFYKIAYRYFDPMGLIFVRLIIAGIFLSLIMLVTRSFEKIRPEDYKRFLLLAFFEPLLYFLGESYGMDLVSSTVGAVIVSTIPLLTPIAAYILFKEKVTVWKVSGILISFSGVLIVLIGKGFVLIAPPLGVALMFVAVFSAVAYTGVVVDLTTRYRSMTIIWVQSLLGALFFLPIFLLTDFKETIAIKITWESMAPVLFLGIFPSSISFILYTRAIRKIGITRANIFTNFIPVFTAIFAFFILKESLTPGKVAGILLVLSGLMLTQVNRTKRKKIPIPRH